MSKNWTIALLLLALISCMWFILTPDRQHDTHSSEHTEVKADNDSLKAHGLDYRRVTDSLSKDNRRLDSANKSLIKGQAVTEGKLNAKTAEVRTLVAQIREINSDTGYFGHLLDSLEEQVKSLQYLIVQYEAYADSINNVNDSMKITFKVSDQEKDKRIAELQAAHDKLFKAYNELFSTTAGLQKDLRRQKLKTKIGAVLAGALAVITLLK